MNAPLSVVDEMFKRPSLVPKEDKTPAPIVASGGVTSPRPDGSTPIVSSVPVASKKSRRPTLANKTVVEQGCEKQPCRNGADCSTDIFRPQGFMCQCQEEFYGELCDFGVCFLCSRFQKNAYVRIRNNVALFAVYVNCRFGK